jgi:glycosyltransferase involved in cell wall biosynthesis
MKVLFISRRFYPNITGGGEISAYYIAKSIKEQGHEVFVLTFTKNKEVKIHKSEGLTIFQVPLPTLKNFKILSGMDYMYFQIARLSLKYGKQINPDIIHLLNFESIHLTSIYLKKKLKCPIVATVNGPNFGCFVQNGIDYNRKTCINCKVGKRFLCSIKNWGTLKGVVYYGYSLWYMNMLKTSYKYIDKFFAVSSAMVPLLNNMGVPKNKIAVIHNPIEIKNKIKTNLRESMGIKNKKILLYAGRLAHDKGIEQTLEAIQNIDNVVYLIIGKKKGQYSYFKKLVNKLNIQKKVIFIGYLDNKELIKYYSIADLVLLPCYVYESLSRMLIEALSYGIPLIANDVGGNKDIITNSINGFLIKKNSKKDLISKINLILENKNLKKTMSINNVKKAKDNFSVKKIGKKIINEYNVLVGK